MIDDHGDTPGEVLVADVGPNEHGPYDTNHNGQQEPPLFHPARPSHDDKDKGIGQRHTEIAGGRHNQPDHDQGVARQLEYGGGAAESPLPLPVHLPGQQQYEGQLGQLRRLQIDRKAGNAQPTVVACLIRADPQWGQEQQIDKQSKQKEPFPGFFRKQLNINRGHGDIDEHPQNDTHRLDQHAAQPRRVVHITGGAVNQHHSEAAGQQAERQQQPVAPVYKFADRIGQPVQPHPSLPKPCLKSI